MFSYTDIPLKIDGEIHRFDFQHLEASALGPEYTVTSEGRELVLNEGFGIVKNDMPDKWTVPVIEKLRELLAGKQTPLP